eukprot:scaffold13823_cov32-Attheya_sp.AAC.1
MGMESKTKGTPSSSMGWQRLSGGVGGVGWVAWKWLGGGVRGKRDVGARKSDSVATLEVEVGDGASSLFSVSLSLFVVSGVTVEVVAWENGGTGEALDGSELFWREKQMEWWWIGRRS